MIWWEVLAAGSAVSAFLLGVIVAIVRARTHEMAAVKQEAADFAFLTNGVRTIQTHLREMLTRMAHVEQCIHRIERESLHADGELRTSLGRIEEHHKQMEHTLTAHFQHSEQIANRLQRVEIHVEAFCKTKRRDDDEV